MSPKVVLYIQEDSETESLVLEFKSWALNKNLQYSVEGSQASLPSGVSAPSIGETSGEVDSDSNSKDWVSGQSFELMENKFSMSSHAKKQQILSLDEVEANVIKEAIQAYEGNLSQVSRKLKIGRATLYRKLKQYNIVASQWMQGFKKAA
ncbi:MAG: hypothetical protein HAW63_05615 [Bdellovibrionaceae bacterium]|nr:hypothetical protein [Pseudobdellovibrionaceae bacterium]